MKFSIKHESRGRIRVQLAQRRMTLDQADLVETWLQGLDAVDQAAVHERTCCAIIYYKEGGRAAVLKALRGFSYQSEEAAKLVVPHTSRATNREYQEKLVGMVCGKAVRDMFFPGGALPVAAAAACGAAGWPVRGHFHGTGRFRHRRFGDVPAGAGRTAGRVDP